MSRLSRVARALWQAVADAGPEGLLCSLAMEQVAQKCDVPLAEVRAARRSLRQEGNLLWFGCRLDPTYTINPERWPVGVQLPAWVGGPRPRGIEKPKPAFLNSVFGLAKAPAVVRPLRSSSKGGRA